MKNISLLAAIILMSLMGCKKSTTEIIDEGSNPKTERPTDAQIKALMGKWTIMEETDKYFTSDGKAVATKTNDVFYTLTFDANIVTYVSVVTNKPGGSTSTTMSSSYKFLKEASNLYIDCYSGYIKGKSTVQKLDQTNLELLYTINAPATINVGGKDIAIVKTEKTIKLKN